MRIERTNDIQEILRCLPFEREIRKKGRDSSKERDMLLFVQSQLNNPLFGFFIAYDDENEIKGYGAGLINLTPGDEGLIALRIYAKDKELKNELERIGSEWAKAFKINKVQITLSKHIKAFQRMGWKVVSVNMERRI